jgi:hypothetical protein
MGQGGQVLRREGGLIQATFHKSRSANGGKDRCWHFSAVPTALSNVGYLGWTGRHMLKASSSHFGPTRDMGVVATSGFWRRLTRLTML